MKFVKESVIRAAPERVFAFHELPDAFERLMPPWENAKIIKKPESLKVGAEAIVAVAFLGLISKQWLARHTAYDPPRMFEDTQISGPFKSWRHKHIVLPHAEGAVLRDEIEFEPPLGLLGKLVAPLAVFRKLEKMFEYRHAVTRKWAEENG